MGPQWTGADCRIGRKERDSRTLATKDEQHRMFTKCRLLGFESRWGLEPASLHAPHCVDTLCDSFEHDFSREILYVKVGKNLLLIAHCVGR